MLKIFFLMPVFFLNLNAITYSLIEPDIKSSFEQFKKVVDQRTNKVKQKLDSIEKGVIKDIKDEIIIKKENTQRLRKISKIDYVTNKEYLFLVKKINELTSNSIDAKNSTTPQPIIIHPTKEEN